VRITQLSIRDFRNLAAVDLTPSPRATILLGENGQGKTNLLEAIYLLATLKPLRAARLTELVRFGQERALVAADFDGPAAVCFAPDDLLLVKAGPEGRRRFLDRAAFNRWPAVLGEARDFVRALRARNAALRTATPEVEVSFRGPLVRTAARLLVRRRALVEELAPRLAAAFAEISGPGAPAALLAYRAAAGVELEGDEAALAGRLAAALQDRLARDREKGYTSAGPHMDDLVLSLDGRAAKSYGSQGQQRALVLALKIAEIENLRQALGRPPLLLLDDVSSELDPAKNRYLLGYLAALPAQVFLTSTDRRLLEPAAGPGSAFFRVENGVVEALVS
jgi:DNA replication and repair protein RecF